MSTNSKIEWTQATWNPVLGCDKVSPGCDSCYAIGQARIREANPNPKVAGAFAGLTERTADGLDWTGRVNLLHDRLKQPTTWRKPKMVFVNSLADLFHDAVPDDFIDAVFAVMADCPQHTFQLLTKRHARLRSYLSRTWPEPLPNVWVGVSVEDQKWADIRVPALIETPAAVRWLSCEPLLGPVDIDRYLWLTGGSTAGPFRDYAGRRRGGGGIGGQMLTAVPARDLHWVVAGGESGRKARPMHPAWARVLRDQCEAAEVPYFFKQFGEYSPYAPMIADPSCVSGSRPDYSRKPVWVELDGRVTEDEDEALGGGQWNGVYRVGKHAAGRQLDGETWDQFPQATAGAA